jgi:phosphatidylglycerophosphate synthase
MKASLQDIRKKCMGNRPEFKIKALDHFGVYVTKAALALNLKPNHLTFLWITIKILGILLLLPGKYIYSLIGMLLVQLASPIDNADGQLARYLNIKSKLGRYADTFSHNITAPLTFVCLGIGAYNAFGQIGYVFIGFATAIIFLIREANSKAEVYEYIKAVSLKEKKAKQKTKDFNLRRRLSNIKEIFAEWFELEYPLSIMFFGVVFYLWREVLLLYFFVILLNCIVKHILILRGLRAYDKKYGSLDILGLEK